ncbi:MAG TPA: uroporphyrinogen decarboxylase family protein [Sumerlaeia bacterium]|nr:uroporphyrinogen decarboxylase family protein [Sumerlaeia bacterium]
MAPIDLPRRRDAYAIDPKPDFARLEKVLRRQGEPDRVPFYELFSNIQDDVLRTLGKLDAEPDAAELSPEESEERAWRKHIDYMRLLGYDYLSVGAYGFGFALPARATALTKEGERAYLQADTHAIANRRDFERHPWPDMSRVDYTPLDRIARLMPPGMRGIPAFSGVLENVMWLLGYEGTAFLLFEDEGLIRDMFEAAGSRIAEYLGRCAASEAVGAVVMGDDLGFRTQTLLSPATYRKHLFPWHARVVEAIHAHGKPAILHACGNRLEIMDDIIACGWDAVHSFEDAIEPVWEAKERWGDRIAVLGGFDVDKLCRMTPEEVRAHTRTLVKRCGPGGGWALGTGNSVANYIPVENFLAMIEEGYRVGRRDASP